MRALNLYQPQRFKARATITMLRLAVGLGLHRGLLPKVRCHGGMVATEPDLPRATPYTLGILLGSPEHRVRRAIASYQNGGEWEVAKISFGETGARVLEDEAAILEELQPLAAGVPRLLGLQWGRTNYLKSSANCHSIHAFLSLQLARKRGSATRFYASFPTRALKSASLSHFTPNGRRS